MDPALLKIEGKTLVFHPGASRKGIIQGNCLSSVTVSDTPEDTVNAFHLNMFRLFRKFRMNLTGSHQVRRYLLYALGEILLVVIGILLALQIDAWNTERLERKKRSPVPEGNSRQPGRRS